jgi:hypothetical protein
MIISLLANPKNNDYFVTRHLPPKKVSINSLLVTVPLKKVSIISLVVTPLKKSND